MEVPHSSKSRMDQQKIIRKRSSAKNRNYKPDVLSSALNAIKKGELSISRAAHHYSIPKSTLRSHIADHAPVNSTVGGCAPVLPSELEQNLVNWLHVRDAMGARVGWQELASAVRELHSNFNLTTCASALPLKKLQRKSPSSGWLVRFKRRHQNVPILRTKKEEWYPPSKFSARTMQEWILKLDERLQVNFQSSVSKLFGDARDNVFNLGLITFSQDISNISISWDLESKNSFAQLVLCFSASCIIKPVLVIKKAMIPYWQKCSADNEFPFDVIPSDEGFNKDIFKTVVNKITEHERTPALPTLLLFDKSLACVDAEACKIAQDKGILFHCFPLHSGEKQPHYFGPLRKILLQEKILSLCNSDEDKLQLISDLWCHEQKKDWTHACLESSGLLPLGSMYKEALQARDCFSSIQSSSEMNKKINSDVVKGMQMALGIIELRCIDPLYLPMYRDLFAKNTVPKNDSMYCVWRELKLEIAKLSRSKEHHQATCEELPLPGERKIDFSTATSSKHDMQATLANTALGALENTNRSTHEPHRSVTNASCELRDSVPISDRYKREFNFDSMPALNLEQHALEILEQYQAMTGSGQLQQLVIDADKDFEADPALL